MRRPAEILLSGQGLTLKNSWCCRQDASRTPCKQPAEGFFWGGGAKCFPPCTDPTLLQPYRWPLWLCNLRSMPGQVFWATRQKKKKLQANRQSTSGGPVYPKVKDQAKANSLFSLQSSPRVRTREHNNRLWVSLSNHSFMEGEWWHGG